jgi:chaperone modulatory protein CbpM
MTEPTPGAASLVEGDLLGEQLALSLDELCRLCAVPPQRIIELLDEGVLGIDYRVDDYRFDAYALRRVRIALRLQRDLEINPAGLGVVLDLLEELEELRRRLLEQRAP